MRDQILLPEGWFKNPGHVFVVEGAPGDAMARWLERRVEEVESAGGRGWILPCSFDWGGPWAGVTELARVLVDLAGDDRRDLLVQHDYELVHILPELHETLEVRHATLTDVSPEEERVRNYPADRAFRMVHGLIELLDELKEDPEEPWVLICDRLDRASHLGRRFFRELIRRRGRRQGLVVLATGEPGAGASVGEALATPDLSIVKGDVSPGFADAVDREASTARARELERRVDGDKQVLQVHLPELIRLWRQLDDPEAAFRWKVKAVSLYPTLGYYEDAYEYATEVEELRKQFAPDDHRLRSLVFGKLYFCLLMLQRPDEAHRLALEEERRTVETGKPLHRAHLLYQLAMLHVRFLPDKDFRKSEEYLERGLTEIAKPDFPQEERAFAHVFNRNGLALVRHRQGRFEEAIELCRSGFQRLEEELDPHHHRLHKSVLIYNIAQVYAAIGEDEEAIEHFSLAIEKDPEYSEYYNDRGSIYLRGGRLEEARRDYLRAIELSAPYQEVHTNLGQCCRRMGRMEEAVSAYSRALDLEPDTVLALLGRAQSYDALGRSSEARDDYDAVLELAPETWEALANRAILHYEAHGLEESAFDLSRAIEIAPDVPDLYRNRATVLGDLDRPAEAAADLETFLLLSPEADDRAEVTARLEALRAQSGA